MLGARATRPPDSSVTSHSVRAMVRPLFTTRPWAVSLAFQTGLRKLILSSSVVKLSPSSKVVPKANAIRDVAEHPAVKGSDWIRVLRAGLELDGGLAVADSGERETDKLRDGWLGNFAANDGLQLVDKPAFWKSFLCHAPRSGFNSDVNPILEGLPSQNGLLTEAPRRQRAARVSAITGSPDSVKIGTFPRT